MRAPLSKVKYRFNPGAEEARTADLYKVVSSAQCALFTDFRTSAPLKRAAISSIWLLSFLLHCYCSFNWTANYLCTILARKRFGRRPNKRVQACAELIEGRSAPASRTQIRRHKPVLGIARTGLFLPARLKSAYGLLMNCNQPDLMAFNHKE